MNNTTFWKMGRRALQLAVIGAAALVFQPGSGDAQSNRPTQSGTVQINQTQVAFIFSGNVGGGKLTYQGKTYPFTISGLGVGGFAVSQLDAHVEVYNLAKITDFSAA